MTGLDVKIRTPGAGERAEAARLVFEPPGPEMTALCGGEANARRLGEALLAAGAHPAPSLDVVAAFLEDRAVGMAAVEATGSRTTHTGVPLRRTVAAVLRAIPPWRLPAMAWRGGLRARLDFPLPANALHVVEVHVTPALRGHGVGGLLLEHAEASARARGLGRLVLSTLANNPARRLYERHGYRVTAEKTVRGYERLTGASGRVFMEKRLPASW